MPQPGMDDLSWPSLDKALSMEQLQQLADSLRRLATVSPSEELERQIKWSQAGGCKVCPVWMMNGRTIPHGREE